MIFPITAPEHPRGVLCIGRSGVDLYPEQFGRMEDVLSFSKHVGGSPANIAVQLGKLNIDVAFCGRVSDDGLGCYVKEYLSSCGVDTSHLKTDKNKRQSLAIAQQPRPGEIEYFFYRDDPADLHLCMSDIDEDYIRSFRFLLVSGASLSRSPAREAILYAVDAAKRNHVDIVFDPDFRKSNWDSLENAALYYNIVAEKASIICATREEMDVVEKLQLPGNRSDEKSAHRLHHLGVQMICIKHGANGSHIFLKDGRIIHGKTMPARIYKTLGAGDSYLGTLLAGILHGKELEDAVEYAAAAAAITISGPSCSDSMPTSDILESYMNAYLQNSIQDWIGWIRKE